MARVIVVGAGVIGLSCAVRLLEHGHDVAVLARDLPLETSSALAPAVWLPHRAYPFERVTGWAAATYAELVRLTEDPDSGVVLTEGAVVGTGSAKPWWSPAVPRLERDSGASGWTFDSPVLDMTVYLPWLSKRVEELGGTLTRMALPALPDRAEIVVHAAGLGARLFADDGAVLPVRSQIVHLEQVGLDRWWYVEDGPLYVVPQEDRVIVAGLEDEGSWDLTPDRARVQELVSRAAQLDPRLTGARVLGTRVGLQPARWSVRLEEAVEAPGQRVVHCYGHGGAGVTLSWGCADEVAAVIAAP